MSLTPLGWVVVAVIAVPVAGVVIWWLLRGAYLPFAYRRARREMREVPGYFSGPCQTYGCRNWVESYDGTRYCVQCASFLNRTRRVGS